MGHCHHKLFLILMCYPHFSWPIQCQAGQYMSESGTNCLACPPNSYMNENTHSHPKCKKCTISENTDVKLVTPCNSTHNSVYHCISGMFNDNGDEIHCQLCHVCTDPKPFEAKACTDETDTICCPYKEMDLVKTSQSLKCGINSTNTDYCCSQPPKATSTLSSVTYGSTEDTVDYGHTTSSTVELRDNTTETGLKAELGPGIIVAIVISVSVVVVAVVIVIIIGIRRRKRSNGNRRNNQGNASVVDSIPLHSGRRD